MKYMMYITGSMSCFGNYNSAFFKFIENVPNEKDKEQFIEECKENKKQSNRNEVYGINDKHLYVEHVKILELSENVFNSFILFKGD